MASSSVGATLRLARIALGMTQRELADRAEVKALSKLLGRESPRQ